MDKMVKIELGGREVFLNYSMEVMFQVIEKYGAVKNALEKLEEDTREGFAVTKHLALLMAHDGELVRRTAGYDHSPFLAEEDVCVHMTPHEFSLFRESVVKAIAAGYGRETKSENEEVDVGLQQLQQKKTKAEAGAPN